MLRAFSSPEAPQKIQAPFFYFAAGVFFFKDPFPLRRGPKKNNHLSLFAIGFYSLLGTFFYSS